MFVMGIDFPCFYNFPIELILKFDGFDCLIIVCLKHFFHKFPNICILYPKPLYFISQTCILYPKPPIFYIPNLCNLYPKSESNLMNNCKEELHIESIITCGTFHKKKKIKLEKHFSI